MDLLPLLRWLMFTSSSISSRVDDEVGQLCLDQHTHCSTVFTLAWHGAAQHDTIQHGPRLHTTIIRGVGWAFEQNGGGKNPLAAVSILSAGSIRRSSVLYSSSRKARAV